MAFYWRTDGGPTLNVGFGSCVVLPRIRTSIAKKPYIFVIFQGGSGPPVPPLDPHMNLIYAILVCISFSCRVLTGIIVASLCWKNNEWVGLTMACAISELLRDIDGILLTSPDSCDANLLHSYALGIVLISLQSWLQICSHIHYLPYTQVIFSLIS